MSFGKQDNWFDVVPPYGQMGIGWQRVAPPQGSVVYRAKVGVDEAWLRINDFPDEPLYTLVVSGTEVIHFNDWPKNWGKEG